MWYDPLLEREVLPDPVLRFGIRRLLRRRLSEEDRGGPAAEGAHRRAFLAELDRSPIAVHTSEANEQHYELPTEFFQAVLGKQLKYSCGYWPEGVEDLDASEEAMLQLTCERADLADGQEVLELGCGWGSLTLAMAQRYPCSRIVAVSNSATQREHVTAAAAARGLDNVEVLTVDMNDLALDRTFDRVVSVEMFEHMRNYRALLAKVAGFLRPGGKLFVHIFTHARHAYLYEDRDDSDWMARYFFTGGMMPSTDLLLAFPEHFTLERRWTLDGTHYRRTSEAWLEKLDRHRAEVTPILERTYGPGRADLWRAYWRIFFLACAELFGYRDGEEWFVSHYRFVKKDTP